MTNAQKVVIGTTASYSKRTYVTVRLSAIVPDSRGRTEGFSPVVATPRAYPLPHENLSPFTMYIDSETGLMVSDVPSFEKWMENGE